MIVAYNQKAAVKIYRRLLELRPEGTEKVHIVASPGNQDDPEYHKLINDRNNKEYAKLFKDDD
jgi:type I restriction enzyme R subunit